MQYLAIRRNNLLEHLKECEHLHVSACMWTHIRTQNQCYFVSQLVCPWISQSDCKIISLMLYLSFQQHNWMACFHMMFFPDLVGHTCYLEKLQFLKLFNSTWLSLIWKSCLAVMKIIIQVGGMKKIHKKLSRKHL